MKPIINKQRRKSRTELNAEGREQKRRKKQRGYAAGSRNNMATNNNTRKQNQRKTSDPRLGSKKPVPLLTATQSTVVIKPDSTAAEELAKLEQDPQLDALLARLEQGEHLTVEEQTYVDDLLDRIDILMTELGIVLEDDDETEIAKASK